MTHPPASLILSLFSGLLNRFSILCVFKRTLAVPLLSSTFRHWSYANLKHKSLFWSHPDWVMVLHSRNIFLSFRFQIYFIYCNFVFYFFFTDFVSLCQIETSASRWARTDGPSRPVSRWSCAAPSRLRMCQSGFSRCRGSSAARRWPWWAPVPCHYWALNMSPERQPDTWRCVKRAPTCICSNCSISNPKMPGNTSVVWPRERRRPLETLLTAARGRAMSRSASSHSVSNNLLINPVYWLSLLL